MPPDPPLHPDFLRGIALFNEGDFFQCHEVLEELWKQVHGDERTFYHALIQAAVCVYHWSRGNLVGVRGLHEHCVEKLDQLPPRYRGIDLARLRRDLDRFVAAVGLDPATPGDLPRLHPAPDAPVRVRAMLDRLTMPLHWPGQSTSKTE